LLIRAQRHGGKEGLKPGGSADNGLEERTEPRDHAQRKESGRTAPTDTAEAKKQYWGEKGWWEKSTSAY